MVGIAVLTYITENVISTDGHSGRATRNVTVGRGVFQAQSAG